MGKMRNCGMRNAEGKMRNGMCGTTVIGRDVTPRDWSHSAFNRTPCVECMEVKCILNMRKIAFCTVHATLRCYFSETADECWKYKSFTFITLLFTTKISTTKRPYAFMLVYTPTPTLILAPRVKGWKCIRPLTFCIPHITHRSAVTFRTFHSAFYLPHAAIPHFTNLLQPVNVSLSEFHLQ